MSLKKVSSDNKTYNSLEIVSVLLALDIAHHQEYLKAMMLALPLSIDILEQLALVLSLLELIDNLEQLAFVLSLLWAIRLSLVLHSGLLRLFLSHFCQQLEAIQEELASTLTFCIDQALK